MDRNDQGAPPVPVAPMTLELILGLGAAAGEVQAALLAQAMEVGYDRGGAQLVTKANKLGNLTGQYINQDLKLVPGEPVPPKDEAMAGIVRLVDNLTTALESTLDQFGARMSSEMLKARRRLCDLGNELVHAATQSDDDSDQGASSSPGPQG